VSTATRVVLEAPAQEFADATANPPYLFDLGPEQGRRTVEEVQSGAIDKPAADIEDLTVPGGPVGDVPVRSSAHRAPPGPCR
jgi:acetyl esterase